MADLVRILSRPIGDEINSVDARELHRALGVGRDFSNWIKARIEELGLVEGVDYEKYNDFASPNLASNRIDYIVTLDAAKHIALAERTEVGKRVRAYFIEAEKRSRNPIALLSDPATLRGLLGSYAERVQALEATVAEQAPKAAIVDRIVDTGDTLGFQCAAKLVKEATGAGQGEFRTMMFQRGWIRRLDGALMPTHIGTERGYVTVRNREYRDNDGAHHCKPELRITQKGLAKAIELLLASEPVE